ncbi:unnamed protein product [Orchesella dallaii]|uniref:Uncharacterized protein n=1 Tax=Orchesella dallaii TaxID=48710 RepID=A0ABP1RKN4_9HEXA
METEKLVLPQKRKTIPAPRRKPETSSFSQTNLTAKPQQRQIRSDPIKLIKVNGPKMEDTNVVELPLQKSILRKLSCANPDIDFEAREKFFNEKIWPIKTKVIRMNVLRNCSCEM